MGVGSNLPLGCELKKCRSLKFDHSDQKHRPIGRPLTKFHDTTCRPEWTAEPGIQTITVLTKADRRRFIHRRPIAVVALYNEGSSGNVHLSHRLVSFLFQKLSTLELWSVGLYDAMFSVKYAQCVKTARWKKHSGALVPVGEAPIQHPSKGR